MHELIDGHAYKIRRAARKVGEERQWPEWRINSLEEWARKEYVRRRADGSLPRGRPLPAGLATGVEAHFKRIEKLVADAKQTIHDCRRRAPDLGIDLAAAPSTQLDDLRAAHRRYDDLRTSAPESLAEHFRREGIATAASVIARMREEAGQDALRGDQIEVLQLYLWAKSVLAQHEQTAP